MKRKSTVVQTTETMVDQDSDEQEIDLVELLFQLLSNIKYIALVTVVCAVAAGLITKFFITPIYESTAKLYVINSSGSVINLSELQIGNYLASDYQEVFKTWEVNEQVISNLHLSYTYAELDKMVKISNPSDTRILYVTVQSANAKEAALIANEYANVFREYVSTVMAMDKPSLFSVALEASNPVSPSLSKNVVIAALLGMLATVGFITIKFIMDDRIKTPDDLMRYIGLPVLAMIPMAEGKTTSRRGQKEDRSA